MHPFARYFAIFSMFTVHWGATAIAHDADGERVFRQRCASCHSIEPDQNRVGPSLANIFGRAAGSVDGARYSEALRNLNLTWDEVTLDHFLADPNALAAGTTMRIRLTNPAQRAAVIQYLNSAE